MGSWFRKNGPGLITPKVCTFAVVVRDADSGEPIEGAGVILSSGQEGHTNQDGYWATTVTVGQAFSFSVNHAPVHVEQDGGVWLLAKDYQLDLGMDRVPMMAPVVVVPDPPVPQAVRRVGQVKGDHRAFVDEGQAGFEGHPNG